MDLSKLRNRTISVISKYISHYTYSNFEDQLIISTGLLNFIWNIWCQFWRNYWIFTIQGGVYLDKTKFIGIYPIMNTSQACAYAAHFRAFPPIRNYRLMDSIAFHREPNWGDYDIIVNIATNLSSNPSLTTRLNYLMALLPNYQDEIKEFQQIRNAFIHLNKSAIKDLETLKPRYIFGSNKDIINILNATRIGNTTPCLQSMVDNMLGVLYNLYEK